METTNGRRPRTTGGSGQLRGRATDAANLTVLVESNEPAGSGGRLTDGRRRAGLRRQPVGGHASRRLVPPEYGR